MAFGRSKVLYLGGVKHSGFRREGIEFRRGNAVKRLFKTGPGHDPVAMSDQFAKMREGRIGRNLLEAIEETAGLVGLDQREGVERVPFRFGKAVGHGGEDGPIDGGANMSRHAFEGAEGGEFAAIANQRLDADIDQIGGDVFDLSGVEHGAPGRAASLMVIGADREEIPDQSVMTIQGAGTVVTG